MRWLPLFACGCLYVSETDFLERLDEDGDGVLASEDCDDTAFDHSQLPFGTANPLTCGTVLTPSELSRTGGRDVAMPCLDPTNPQGLLAIPEAAREFRFVTDFPTTVTVNFLGPSPDWGEVVAEDEVLVANRGRICGVDRCTPGVPLLINGRFSGGERFARATFDVEPDEEVFLLTSVSGPFRVRVDCEPSPPPADVEL